LRTPPGPEGSNGKQILPCVSAWLSAKSL